MRFRFAGLLLLSGLCGLSLWRVAVAQPAGPVERAAAVSAVVLPLIEEGADAEYVGSNKCKKCHMAQYKSWAKTKMAMALQSLKPGEKVEAKKKANLDPDKDYTTDEQCLKCHTVGLGEKGGYFIADPEDTKAVKKARKRAGVGCESCHGAGGAYIKQHDEIMKSKRTYAVEEMYKAGLRKADASVCAECHNDKSPTYHADEPFDFEKRKDADTHEHKELKQRQD